MGLCDILIGRLRAFRAYLTPTAPHPPHAYRGPASHRSAAHNFRSMDLKEYRVVPDGAGRWWAAETRQCPYSGLIIREMRRITD